MADTIKNLDHETIQAIKNFCGARAITLETANVHIDGNTGKRTVNISISLRGRATAGDFKRDLRDYCPELWKDNHLIVINGANA